MSRQVFFLCFLWCGVRALSFHRILYMQEGSVVSMAVRGPGYCGHPGCACVLPYGNKYCDKHKAEHRRDRPSAGKRGFNSLPGITFHH